MPAFTALTLNLHMGFDMLKRRFVLPELREALRGVPADVVFLQEVLGAHAGHALRHRNWPSGPQYEYLADATWAQHAYGRNAAYPDGHHGNALLSKFPILSQRNRDVSVDGHEQRGLLHCVLEQPGGAKPLHAICVHLGLRESHRRRQLDRLCDMVRDDVPAQAPLVVAGDFNDWRGRGHRTLLDCGLHEAFERVHGRIAKTFPSRWPLLAVDRVYLRHARALSAQALTASPWSRLSDHAPLLVSVET